MNLKEQLAAKKAELAALKSQIAAGDAEAIKAGEEIAEAIKNIEASIKSAEAAQALLAQIGNEDPAEAPAEEDGLKSLMTQAKSVDKNVKGWSISANVKASTDTMTSVQIADIDKTVVPQAKANRVTDLFSAATISGNSVTYFTEDAFEGSSPAVVAEGAKKAQGSTGYTSHTEALIKIAGYVKETDEVLEDNNFLASAVEDVMRYRLGKVENAYAIGKIQGTSGIGTVTYTDSGHTGDADSLIDAILYAKTQIDSTTPYTADCVLVNPADYFALITAKDDNGQYLGGGYFTGAYGNGAYSAQYNPWGLNIFVDSNVVSGEPIVAAGKEAIKFYTKNGATVKVYEQNEDDALYNRVTVLAEERGLVVVKCPAAVVAISAATA
jgi:hypothetical protein